MIKQTTFEQKCEYESQHSAIGSTCPRTEQRATERGRERAAIVLGNVAKEKIKKKEEKMSK